ncbi:MAG: preprotein translocase subunit SecG [Candidatus Moraniibacteriota bacterium]|jgi:preprotein translocase subunit SecG
MKTLLMIQAIVSILLVVVILMQNKGEGLGVVAGDFSGSYHTKRGFEKFLTRSTVVLSVLFLGIALTIARVSS